MVQQHPANSSSSFDCHASQLRKVRPPSGEILVQHENPALRSASRSDNVLMDRMSLSSRL